MVDIPGRLTATRVMTAVGLALALAACGGGGGGSSRPVPTPTPTPAPAPAPAPTPTPTPGEVDSDEYDASASAKQANALAAYEKGHTGAGVKIAVVDSGINPDLRDFRGRIDPASADVASSRGVSDIDGHGTAVTAIAAAAADGFDMLGVAHEATIISLRADDPASCGRADGCEFFDDAIARGVDIAVDAGARVINLSLGGESMGRQLLLSLQRAADAGIVIVISAGNEGQLSEGDNPSRFASDAHAGLAGGTLIIAGSVGTGADPHAISDFSNRAGTGREVYLTARGWRVQAPDHTGDQFLWSGTSFAAPAISGAVALLAQAFPNLTGAEIVEILFDSATDLGELGIDAIYGNGELDIGAAFAPAGTTRVAGTKQPISLSDNGQLPAAAGDAAQGSMATLVADKYDRAYRFDVNASLERARAAQPLHRGINGAGISQRTLDMGRLAVSVSYAPSEQGGVAFGPLFDDLGNDDRDRARAIAGSIVARIDKDTLAAFGFAKGASALSDQLSGIGGGHFLVAQRGLEEAGFAAARDHSFAVRRDLGPVALTLTSESGAQWIPLADNGQDAHYRIDGIAFDRPTPGNGRIRVGFSLLDERETLLGGRLSPALGDDGSGARTRFFDLALVQPIGRGLTLGLSARRGETRFSGGAMRTGAYAIDLSKSSLFMAGDRAGVRVAQPLRVESGGLNLYLPQEWDWRTESATMGWQLLPLTPSGRELVGELAYGRPLLGGRIDFNAFYRRQPGHVAAADGDVGAALRYSIGL